MSAIRSKDTRPELMIRRGLHARGFRYALHHRKLPGHPDLVLKKHRAVVFVHGCFWHGHECSLFRWPATRQEFWRAKILGNRIVDARAVADLREAGWRILTIWECALKGRHKRGLAQVLDLTERWLGSNREQEEIAGTDRVP